MAKPKFDLGDVVYTVSSEGNIGEDLKVKIFRSVVKEIKIDMQTEEWQYWVKMHDITKNPLREDFKNGAFHHEELSESDIFDNLKDALTAYSSKINNHFKKQISLYEKATEDINEQLAIINNKID